MTEQSELSSNQFGPGMKLFEKFIFEHRPALLVILFLATLFFAYQASQLKLDTSFLKMIPTKHPFIENMVANLDNLGAVGTVLQIAVETTDENIFTKEYIKTVQLINDETFYIKGVNRSGLESIWTPNVRWSEVTEEGFEGGPLIPETYDGSPAMLAELRKNMLRSGRVGSLIADDFKSTIVQATLYDKDPTTGKTLDYYTFSKEIEEKIRQRYQSDNIKIHIIGVAKIIGDLTEASLSIATFFAFAILITFFVLIWYTQCITSTITLITCAIISVIWQLGILQTINMPLSAYSILVPFLIFAISISHGIQNINTTALRMADGDSAYVASQDAFRSLFVPGLTALLGDGVGFITLWIIDIPSIKELAIAASIGIAVIIFTKLILLTILMSYVGVTPSGINHFKNRNLKEPLLWKAASQIATPKIATIAITSAIIFTASLYFFLGQYVKVGDLDEGAPELRPDSTYNMDSKYIADNYSVSSDIFMIMSRSKIQSCLNYENLEVIDRFGWTMENVKGVESTKSLTFAVRQIISGFNEASLKWHTIPRNQQIINNTIFHIPRQLVNSDCTYAPIILFLSDHKSETLERVVAAAEDFIKKNPMKDIEFLLAAGNAGIEAATNDVIVDAYYTMLFFVYAVVSLLVFVSFRSLRASICIILPLVVTSILCDSLMAYMEIGLKVATLPVVALSVGIGVDYSIYIYAKMETYLYQGMSLIDAYYKTLKTTGNAIVLTALTLAIGVITWAWSPIKFQADMGILLTFMFIWNMIGAILLLPALCCFLIKPDKIQAKKDR